MNYTNKILPSIMWFLEAKSICKFMHQEHSLPVPRNISILEFARALQRLAGEDENSNAVNKTVTNAFDVVSDPKQTIRELKKLEKSLKSVSESLSNLGSYSKLIINKGDVSHTSFEENSHSLLLHVTELIKEREELSSLRGRAIMQHNYIAGNWCSRWLHKIYPDSNITKYTYNPYQEEYSGGTLNFARLVIDALGLDEMSDKNIATAIERYGGKT